MSVPITLADIRPLPEYLAEREAILARVRILKQARKVAVGPRIWLTFENRATMIAQIQEMCRVEDLTEAPAIQREIDTYNALLPAGDDLSATLFIGVTDRDRVAAELDALVGLNQHVWLELGGSRIPAIFEQGRETATRVSAVQYVRFGLDAAEQARFSDAAATTEVALVIDHPAYRARTVLSATTRAALARDFASSADPSAGGDRQSAGGADPSAGTPAAVQRRERVFTGTPWETEVGYCRAVRDGRHIWVTGTAPVNPDGSVHAPGDACAQARRCFAIVEEALEALGASRQAVVRTRMFVTDITRWAEYGRAHREFFADHPPATTMVQVQALIDPAMLIEVEVDAALPQAPAGS